MRSMQMHNSEKVLLEIWGLLREINVTFFLRHGTCLGAVRDGELIPWDDDIDIGSIIGMHNLDESTIYKAVQKFESADFEVKVLETDFHIGVELSKYSIPIDWTCYRVHEESILQYPGVKIPVHLYESLGSVPLLGKTFFVPNPPEEYLTLKYGPNWRVPKQRGFEADIIDSRSLGNSMPLKEISSEMMILISIFTMTIKALNVLAVQSGRQISLKKDLQ